MSGFFFISPVVQTCLYSKNPAAESRINFLGVKSYVLVCLDDWHISSDVQIEYRENDIKLHLRRKSMKEYFYKMTGDKTYSHPISKPVIILLSGLGACLGIGIVAYFTHATNVVLLMAPFGATCALAFGAPEAPLAQPRNIVGGHLLSSLIGFLCLYLFGNTWWSIALAVGLSISAMQVTKTLHPPAGADPIVVILTQPSWNFLFAPVLFGSLIITVAALIYNNLIKERRYPKYWL
jgi:CBS-domain-containing membrane protein